MTGIARARRGVGDFTLVLCLSLVTLLLAATTARGQEQDSAQPYAFEVKAINEGLAGSDATLRLDTPRATLESFLAAVDENDLVSAAQALNRDCQKNSA
jgi:hypothetical protein